MKPASYLKLAESGELAERASRAWLHLEACDLCARHCRINRLETIKGAGPVSARSCTAMARIMAGLPADHAPLALMPMGHPR